MDWRRPLYGKPKAEIARCPAVPATGWYGMNDDERWNVGGLDGGHELDSFKEVKHLEGRAGP